MTTYFTPLAPHHLPVAETAVPVVNTAQACQIAAQWTCTWRPALTAFATSDHLDPDNLTAAVSDVRADLAEISGADAHGLHTVLVHLQSLCESHGIAHLDDESYWCWCQPYLIPAPVPAAA